MPLKVTDFTWSETDDKVFITVPLKVMLRLVEPLSPYQTVHCRVCLWWASSLAGLLAVPTRLTGQPFVPLLLACVVYRVTVCVFASM